MKELMNEVREIRFPTVEDARGYLTFLEGEVHLPFEIKRVFYLHSIPVGAERGGHALRTTWQCLVPISGSFRVCLDDGISKKWVTLHDSRSGLLIPPLVWRTMDDFSSGSICLVMASEKYEESEYLRRYPDYLAHRNEAVV